MSSHVILLMVQVDDASGEVLGEVMQRLTEMGAKNVQLLSSLAKKGRPGYVLLIDILAEQEMEAAALLAGELGVWGYRVLHSDHKHFAIERYVTTLEIVIGKEKGSEIDSEIQSFSIRIKRILHEGRFLRVKAEHDDLSGICAALRTKGKQVSLSVLKSQIETELGSAIPGDKLRITLG